MNQFSDPKKRKTDGIHKRLGAKPSAPSLRQRKMPPTIAFTPAEEITREVSRRVAQDAIKKRTPAPLMLQPINPPPTIQTVQKEVMTQEPPSSNDAAPTSMGASSPFSSFDMRQAVQPVKKEETLPQNVATETPSTVASVNAPHEATAGATGIKKIGPSSWIAGYRTAETPEQTFFHKNEARASSSLKGWVYGSIAGFGVLAAIAIIMTTVFARSTIVLRRHSETIDTMNLSVALDTNITAVTVPNALPAEHLTLSKVLSIEVRATGKALRREFAKGTIRIYNAFSASPQTLVKTTRFLTENKKLYRLTNTITVPAAKKEHNSITPTFIEAEVQADQQGPQFNADGEVRLSIPGFQGTPKYTGFYAIAPTGFSDGFDGEGIIATKEDIETATKEITKRIYDELKIEMQKKIPSGFLTVNGLNEVTITNIQIPKVVRPTERFLITAEAKADAFIFRQSDILKLLHVALLGTSTTRELLSNTTNLAYEVEELDIGTKTANMKIKGSLKAQAVMDPTALKMMFGGKTKSEIHSYIQELKGQEILDSADITFFPPWRSRAPARLENILITVQ